MAVSESHAPIFCQPATFLDVSTVTSTSTGYDTVLVGSDKSLYRNQHQHPQQLLCVRSRAVSIIVSKVRFSNRPFEVKHFQTTHHCGVERQTNLITLREKRRSAREYRESDNKANLRHNAPTAKRAPASAARGTTYDTSSSSRAAPAAHAACTSTPRRFCLARPSATRRSRSDCMTSRARPRGR